MAQVVNVNFRMDAELKKSMEQAYSELGMSMTTAFTIFAEKVSREKEFHLMYVSLRFILSKICVIQKKQLVMFHREKRILQSMSCWKWMSSAITLGRLSGYWSRRIDEVNRIVYFEQGNIIYVISCRGHYENQIQNYFFSCQQLRQVCLRRYFYISNAVVYKSQYQFLRLSKNKRIFIFGTSSSI